MCFWSTICVNRWVMSNSSSSWSVPEFGIIERISLIYPGLTRIQGSKHSLEGPLPSHGVIDLVCWSLAFFARVAEAAKAGCPAHPAAEMEGRALCWYMLNLTFVEMLIYDALCRKGCQHLPSYFHAGIFNVTWFYCALKAPVLSLLWGHSLVTSLRRTEIDWSIAKWFIQLIGESTEPR